VVVAELWLAAGETVLESADIRDRRVTNQAGVEATPNEPNWVEDPNSPINASGNQSHTITLSETYDAVKIVIQSFKNTSGAFQDIGIRANGETADYRWVEFTGALVDTQEDWKLGGFSDLEQLSSQFELWSQIGSVTLRGPIGDVVNGEGITYGTNINLGDTVNSITFRGRSGSVSIKARIYGWNGGL